jgi:hypothetical protein
MTTRMKEVGMERQQKEEFWHKMEKPKSRRNDCVGGMGGIFCKKCGLFYDGKQLNISSYLSCSKHKGLQGYRIT